MPPSPIGSTVGIYRSDDARRNLDTHHHRSAPRRAHRRRRPAGARRSIRRIPTSSTSPAPSPGNPPTAARPGPAFAARPAATTIRTSGSIRTIPTSSCIVSDQGAIVTVNGGQTWSSWYNQPTAQLYHVTADNAFPYRLCGGQQESGSACVASRGNDGEITFREWHPVGVEEYGYAAPDPLDPDIVYGGKAHALRSPHRPGAERRAEAACVRPISASCAPRRCCFRPSIRTPSTSPRTRCGRRATAAHSWTADQPRPHAQDLGVPASVGKYRDAPSAQAHRSAA